MTEDSQHPAQVLVAPFYGIGLGIISWSGRELDLEGLIHTPDQLADEIRSLVRMDLFWHPEPTEDVATQDGCYILRGSISRGISF